MCWQEREAAINDVHWRSSQVSCLSTCGHYSALVCLSLYLWMFAYDLHTSTANIIIQCSPSPSITLTNSKHSRPGKQHYLSANHSHGVRQLQTLHVTPPCHLHYTHTHTHLCTHSETHPLVSNHPAHFLPISSLSRSLSLPLYMSFSVTRLVQNCSEASCHSIEE